MAEIGVIIYLIFYSMFLFTAIGLFVYSFILGKGTQPADKKQPKGAKCVLFFCVLCYILAAIFVFLGLIMYLIYGFPTEGATASMRSALTLFYALAFFLMLYVWIQRIQITFTGSAYEYTPRFLLIIKCIFWTVVILGLAVSVLFIINGGGNSEEGTALSTVVTIVSGLLMIAFFTLLAVIIYTFISRLNQLRKIAENRLNKISKSGDYDFESLEVIQKLVKLQLKLTICSIIAIISSVFAIPLAIINDGLPEFMIYGPDCIIGFLCMYCTIKSNTEFYMKICKGCIIICNCCFNTTILDQQIGHHIEVHSRTLQTSGITISGDTTTNNDTTHATPRPSANHAMNESMPVDSVTLQNQQSENQQSQNTQITEMESQMTDVITSDQ